MRRTFYARKLAGCFYSTKSSYVSKGQGKFDFSSHEPLNKPKTNVNHLQAYCFKAPNWGRRKSFNTDKKTLALNKIIKIKCNEYIFKNIFFSINTRGLG